MHMYIVNLWHNHVSNTNNPWNCQLHNSYLHASKEKINNKYYEIEEWKSYPSTYLSWSCYNGSLLIYQYRIEIIETTSSIPVAIRCWKCWSEDKINQKVLGNSLIIGNASFPTHVLGVGSTIMLQGIEESYTSRPRNS